MERKGRRRERERGKEDTERFKSCSLLKKREREIMFIK